MNPILPPTPDSIPSWIGYLLALLVGLGPWVRSQLRKSQELEDSREEKISKREIAYSKLLQDRIDEKVSQLTRMETRVEERDKAIEHLTQDLIAARTQNNEDPVDVVAKIISADPGISFAKKRIGPGEFRMIRVSEGFAKTLLEGPAEMYDGHPDEEFFEKESAIKYNEDDEKVYTSQEGLSVKDLFTSSTSGFSGWFYGRKYHVRLSDGTDVIIGTGDLRQHVPDQE